MSDIDDLIRELKKTANSDVDLNVMVLEVADVATRLWVHDNELKTVDDAFAAALRFTIGKRRFLSKWNKQ